VNLSPIAARQDVALAFSHLASLTGAADPADYVRSMREIVRNYGDVEPRQPLAAVTCTPAADAPVGAEWVCAPNADPKRRIVYLHGGGWMAGDLYSHRPIAAALSKVAGAAVLLVDYRLAPEFPFPAGLQDCIAATTFAQAHGPDGPGEAARLALVGDSAGGNFAAASCFRLTQSGGPTPDRLVLICAALDTTGQRPKTPSPSSEEDATSLAHLMSMYAPDGPPLTDPYISPGLASDELLRRLPPTMLQVSSAEFLFADSQRFADRLAANGVRSILSTWPGMPHVWHAFLSTLPEASMALAEIGAFVASSDTRGR